MNAEEVKAEENLKAENQAGESLEKTAETKPVAFYSASFEPVVSDFAEKGILPKRKTPLSGAAASGDKKLSAKIFNWRNAVPLGAILAIGVLHFAFQISVIRPEVSENRPATIDVPPVKIEPARTAPVENAPAASPSEAVKTRTEKSDLVNVPAEKTSFRVKPRQVGAAPVAPAPAKPSVKKKEAGESRAERLRRAEKILTGI